LFSELFFLKARFLHDVNASCCFKFWQLRQLGLLPFQRWTRTFAKTAYDQPSSGYSFVSIKGHRQSSKRHICVQCGNVKHAANNYNAKNVPFKDQVRDINKGSQNDKNIFGL
jgi:hypothetical protein